MSRFLVRWMLTGVLALLAAIPACSQRVAPRDLASDMATLDRLYQQATAAPQYRRAVRKPVRDAQARAMGRLADHADAMMARADESPTAMALAGKAPEAAWTGELAAVKAAAARRDRAGLTRAYARLAAARERLDDSATAK